MNRIELVKTLDLVRSALATTNMIPIFQCFTFSKGTVMAYNDIIAISGPVDTKLEFATHGNTLLGLLDNSGDAELVIELKDASAILKIGKTISKLPFFDKTSFIFEEPSPDDFETEIPFNESLAHGLSMCLANVSNDETQPALHGVTLHDKNLYGCNSDALIRVALKGGIKGRVLLSTQFCTAVLKLWAELEMTTGSIFISKEWVYADFDKWGIYGRVLEIPEPIDFEQLIKRSLKTKVTTYDVPEGFSKSLSRARVLADPESQRTDIVVASGKMELLTETHMGEVKDRLICKSHPDVTVRVNAGHLQKALDHSDKIAFTEKCTVLEKAPNVFQIVSNMA